MFDDSIEGLENYSMVQKANDNCHWKVAGFKMQVSTTKKGFSSQADSKFPCGGKPWETD
jgi:hypothetical protein